MRMYKHIPIYIYLYLYLYILTHAGTLIMRQLEQLIICKHALLLNIVFMTLIYVADHGVHIRIPVYTYIHEYVLCSIYRINQ